MTLLEHNLHTRLRQHCMERGAYRVKCYECDRQWLGLELKDELHREDCLARMPDEASVITQPDEPIGP